MGMLLQCQRCGTLFSDCVCPKCGSLEAPAEFHRRREIIEQYRERKHQFRNRQAISLGLGVGLVVTTMAMMGLGWSARIWDVLFGSLSHPDAVDGNIVLAGLLGAASVVLGVLWIKSGEWWPLDLRCPVCDHRLDPSKGPIDCCPGCDANLRAPSLAPPRRATPRIGRHRRRLSSSDSWPSR